METASRLVAVEVCGELCGLLGQPRGAGVPERPKLVYRTDKQAR